MENVEGVSDTLAEIIAERATWLAQEDVKKLADRCVVSSWQFVLRNYKKIDSNRMNLLFATKINALIDKLTEEIIKKIVVDKSIRVRNILETDIYDLNKELRDIKVSIANKINEEENSNAYDIFKCPRCKARRHTTREIQIKAIDEASSSVNECLECGKRWIIHG